MNQIKTVLRDAPVVGPALTRAKHAYDRRRFPGSAAYWKSATGGARHQGPGSGGVDARFKAAIGYGYVFVLGLLVQLRLSQKCFGG